MFIIFSKRTSSKIVRKYKKKLSKMHICSPKIKKRIATLNEASGIWFSNSVGLVDITNILEIDSNKRLLIFSLLVSMSQSRSTL